MKKNLIAIASIMALTLAVPAGVSAQTVTASTQTKIQITKGASPASLKRQLKEQLELRAVKNLLEASFAVKMTPAIEAKLPELVELLGDSIQISMDPADGEVLSGKATITVASAKLKEYLVNKGIGAGDIASKSAKILVSIDEFIGVATANDGKTATETEIQYSHDKSSFSDTSASASGSERSASSSASSRQNDVAFASKEAVAVSGRQSSAVAARQDTAVAGRRDTAVAVQGQGGRAAAASSTQYAGAQSTQYQAAQSSQFAGAASSSTAFSDKSKSASASSASSASSFSTDQKNVQQQTDKVSYSVKTKMPEFNNAKPLGAQDRVLASRLSGEFQNNGLSLVAENDLRAEGGRILPIFEITNNGRVDQFVEKIQKNKIEADVWATGQANYTIVGTTPTGTQCNGNLAVQGRFIDGNEIFFEDSLQAAAVGNGDQDCRGRLGIALATSLAQILGQRANKELNARASRGSVFTLYLYSASSLGRGDRNKFQTTLRSTEGLQAGEPKTGDNFMTVSVQMAGSLDATINKVLDSLNWEKADYVSRPGNRICIGLEGKQVCPADLR
ncbi:MAG: hypothetical protein ACOVLL_06315 [Hydrogenophaga sp.]